jgi:hypothetical protein
MNSAGAEMPGSSSTGLENPAGMFGGQSGFNPELVPQNESAEAVSSEASERRSVPTENTPQEQNLGATHEFTSSSSLAAITPETQTRDSVSTGTPHEFLSVTENEPQTTTINTATKDTLQNQGFVGGDSKPDALQTNVTSPSPQAFSTRGINPEGTPAKAGHAAPCPVTDAETDVLHPTPGSSTSEFQTATLTAAPPAPLLASSTPADVWWGGFMKRNHGFPKAQTVARLLETASKGKSAISNRPSDRMRRLK